MTDLASLAGRDGDVYKQERPAATLTRTPEGVRFAYRRDYLDAHGAPVATTLPLSEQPVVTPGGAVPPYFAGLLPEGRRLTGLRRAVKTSADDELSLLLAVGRDPVGDVRVLPSGATPDAPPEPLVSVARSFEEVTFRDLMEAAEIVDPVALAGVQDKASARMISLPVSRAGRRFILKVDPPEYPLVVENEAFFIAAARRARIPAVRADVVHDATGRPGLLVERFDRVLDADGAPVSLAMEDAAQVLGRYPADKYLVTAEEVTSALSHLCAARVAAAREVFRQLCFAWLTGNGDVHAKNLSVLGTMAGEWHIAPAYDLPSTVPYGDATMALAMGGRRDGLSRRSLLAFAGAAGIPARAAESALEQALGATDDITTAIADGVVPFAPDVRKKWAATLRRRHRDAQG